VVLGYDIGTRVMAAIQPGLTTGLKLPYGIAGTFGAAAAGGSYVLLILGMMGLVWGAIFAPFLGGPRLSGGRVVPVYAIDDFLQGQGRHNKLQGQDAMSLPLPRLDRNTVDYRGLIRPRCEAAATKVFPQGKVCLVRSRV
jgi:hypothetical protein